METGEINPAELPWDIDLAMGEVKSAEIRCLGVFYVGLYAPFEADTEFYIIAKNTDAISDAAKAYGHQIEDLPDCLIYPFESEHKGRRIIDYEIQRYYVKYGCPEADSMELRESAAYGMELCPEYFGAFFPPSNTPLGHVVRYKTLINGIFWAETDEAKRMIAVAFPRWIDVFTSYTLQFAIRVERDADGKKDATFEYLCFPEEVFPLALFELQRYYPELKNSPYIDNRALMNVLYRDFLDYAVSFNRLEQSGASDMAGLLRYAMGEDLVELEGSAEDVISLTLDAGFDYFRL